MNTTITPEISTFAREVRAALADLPTEERDELTDGLEADLAEAYAEDLSRSLPDPVEYALELRNAAGLPQREEVKEGLFATLGLSARRARSDLGRVVRDNPALASVADFLASLRPFWWVARAWAASWLVAAMFGGEGGFVPTGLAYWAVLVVFVLISVQWGRGRWRFRGLAPAIVIGNVLAAALFVPVVAMASDWSTNVNYSYVDGGPGDLTGVYLDGVPVTNIFPYDADGKPLTDVQLFDQDGKLLSTAVPGANGCLDADCTEESLWVARVIDSGVSVFNVFPLAMVPAEYDDYSGGLNPRADAVPQRRPLPFKQVPGVTIAKKVAPSNE